MALFGRRKKDNSMNLKVILLLVIALWVSRIDTAWPFASIVVHVHEDITRLALQQDYNNNPFGFFEVLSSGQVVVFSKKALKQIVIANRDSDKGASFGDPKRHFDNEKFIDSSLWLKERKKIIIFLLTRTNPDGDLARKYLGQALHAVQDYYSHTNWSEVHGRTTINEDLGKFEHADGPAQSPCPDFPSKLATGLTDITSGFYVIGELCNPVIRNSTNRCIHGNLPDGLFPFTEGSCAGINKDHGARPGFRDARDLAVAATRDFVQQIIDDINANSSIQNKDQAIRTLMDQLGEWKFQLQREGAAGDEENWEDIDDSWAVVQFFFERADGGEDVEIAVRFGVMDAVGTKHTNIDSTGTIEGVTYNAGNKTWTVNWTPEAPADPDDPQETSWRVWVLAVKTDTGTYELIGGDTINPPAPYGFRSFGIYDGTLKTQAISKTDPTQRLYIGVDSGSIHTPGKFTMTLPYFKERYLFHQGITMSTIKQEIAVTSNVPWDIKYQGWFSPSLGTLNDEQGTRINSLFGQTTVKTVNSPPVFSEQFYSMSVVVTNTSPHNVGNSSSLSQRGWFLAVNLPPVPFNGTILDMVPNNVVIFEDNPLIP
jgi:hypothetical protein